MENNYHANEIQQMAATLHHEECYPPTPYKSNAYPREGFIFPSIHPVFTSGIESYLDPKYAADPAAFASRLPYFPFHAAYGMYEFEPAFIRKRNERERQRVKLVNEGYTTLREHLPDEFAEKRLSKVETLRGAIQYIKHLQQLLGVDKDGTNETKIYEENCTTKKQDFNQNSDTPCTDKTTSSTDTTLFSKTSKNEFSNKMPIEEVTIIGSQIMTKNPNYSTSSCMFDKAVGTTKSSDPYASNLPWSGNTFQNINAYSSKNEHYSSSNQLKSRIHFADSRSQINQKKRHNFNISGQQGSPQYHVNFHSQFSNNGYYPGKNSGKEQPYSFDVFTQEHSKTNFMSPERHYSSHYNSTCLIPHSMKNYPHQNSPLNEVQYPTNFRTSTSCDFHHNNGGSDGFKSDNSPSSSTFSTSP